MRTFKEWGVIRAYNTEQRQKVLNQMNRIYFGVLIVVMVFLGACSSDTDITPEGEKQSGSENTSGVDSLYYLALGDSYTIGASVEPKERFPEQLTARLNAVHQDSVFIKSPDIIAKSGWTSSNLLDAAEQAEALNRPYDLVTLLVGVNNQYQRLPFVTFERDLEDLLHFAIEAAAGDTSRLVLVSVPDYAYTPFGQNFGEPAQISSEIEKYNGYLELQAEVYGIPFINVTPMSREGLQNPDLLAGDGLHPSAKMYTGWVNLMIRDAEKALSLQ
jgi:lysophospholipase L1-like esterase